VNSHHGLGAVLHRRARHHLLNGARADGARLPFALDGKAFGPVPDDQVDAPVTGDGRHDHRHSAGPRDARDVILELDPRHLRRDALGRAWGARTDDRAQQETRARGENSRREGADCQAPHRGRAEKVRGDA
jgi:hypothetical protein